MLPSDESRLLWMNSIAPPPHLASNSLMTVNQLNDPVIVSNFISPRWAPSICYNMGCRWLQGGDYYFLFNTHTLTKCAQASSAVPEVRLFSLSFLFAFLFALFYPFAGTSGNRKWHWPLLIPPITFVKRECGMESHIRGRVVIIFAMPSAWINHSGRLLVEVRSQPWIEPAATLRDWQFW